MTDWDDAFANAAHIPGADAIVASWPLRAKAFRRSGVRIDRDIRYGPRPRNRLDLVWPEGACKGLVVFVHGGFWLDFDKSDWTDLAQGARAHGWAVALPSYTLAPEARISDITAEIGAAVRAAASRVEGPVRLVGHSAGGHLVARMVCDDSPLDPATLNRVEKVLTISGLHDLRPLRHTRMNAVLGLAAWEAARESAALHLPVATIPVTCWVGAGERPEFLHQTRLLAALWHGTTATRLVEERGKNHFSVLDGLGDPESPIVAELLDRCGRSLARFLPQ
ncbi:alpha/beta hydrolase [Paracoccus angustae]|uniref:Alpha/beta hydrolase n=1 Tax=Paracoccus angustae TaxID=1671480 RepID=A0ABV7U6J3_9RHOB